MFKRLVTIALLIVMGLISPSLHAEDAANSEASRVASTAPDAKPAWAANWKTPQQPVETVGYSMFLGLGLCLAVLSVGVWAAKKFGWVQPAKRAGRLKVIERTALSAKTSLCLVEAQGKQFLVSVGSERVSVVSRLSVEDSLEGAESFEELVCDRTEKLAAC